MGRGEVEPVTEGKWIQVCCRLGDHLWKTQIGDSAKLAAANFEFALSFAIQQVSKSPDWPGMSAAKEAVWWVEEL